MLQVVALDIDLPVKQAFHILHEQACLFPILPSAPILSLFFSLRA